MSGTVITAAVLVIGIMILGAGVYYFIKEKEDDVSRKIYAITTVIGVGIVIGVIIKVMIAGF